MGSALKRHATHITLDDDGWARKRAREALRFVQGENLRVLNAGCGPGFDSEEFRKAGHYVVGIDFDSKVVDFAVENGLQQEGKVADLNKRLPFRDSSFDVVFCSEVVEHLPVISVFLRECGRVLKKGGMLLLTTDNPAYIKHRIRLLFGKADFLAYESHVHLYTPARMRQLLEEHGFAVLRMKNLGNIPIVSFGDVYLAVAKKGG